MSPPRRRPGPRGPGPLATTVLAELGLSCPPHRRTAAIPVDLLVDGSLVPVAVPAGVNPAWLWVPNHGFHPTNRRPLTLRFAVFHRGTCLGVFDARPVLRHLWADAARPGRWNAKLVVRGHELSGQFLVPVRDGVIS